jgi:hypothetical protein
MKSLLQAEEKVKIIQLKFFVIISRFLGTCNRRKISKKY